MSKADALARTEENIKNNTMDILDRYEILTPLNQNEDVFLVMNRETKEVCVEKMTLVCDKAIYERMMEAPIEGVPKIYEIGDAGDKLIIIEEYIHGLNLEQIFHQKGLFKERDVAKYMIRLCQILKSFHGMQPKVIHKDIKPENLILANHGDIYLIDFNVSREYKPEKETDTTKIVSYHFSAPELYGLGQSNVRSDIFSIGATMHYLLTGGYIKESVYDGPLSKIVDKCAMMEPENRYQSVEELEKKLKHFLFFHRKDKEASETRRKKNHNPEKISLLKKIDSYSLPGFRTKKLWKIALATSVYAFLIYLFFAMEIISSVKGSLAFVDVFIEKLLTVSFGFLSIFLIFDYRGCQKYMPFGKWIKIKAIRIILSLFLLFSAMFFFMVVDAWLLDLFP